MAIIMIQGERHVVNQCGTCAVWHTIPEIIYDCCKREGGFWHCPNGHSRGWAKGTDEAEREKIRRERDQLKQDAARLEATIMEQRTRAETAEKKYVQARKRAAAGTCPCCQRTFSNMSTHMKRHHPDFVADTGANVVPIKVAKPR